MDFIKALLPGAALSAIIAGIIGSNHSKGGWLTIEPLTVMDHSFYWSWPLFVAGTGLAWVLFAITPK